jgi:hypothetical protein
MLRLDLMRTSHMRALPSELISLAKQLESVELIEEAAEVYARAGDGKNQARVLAASGSIEALEKALESERQEREAKHQQQQLWKEVKDLDAIGKRLACLQHCDNWLLTHPSDETIADFARTVRSRLVKKGPTLLRIQGKVMNLVLDSPVIIGRSDASVVIPSPMLSRQHLQLIAQHEIMLEDLGSRNGTWLAGARIDGRLPIRTKLDLLLGGQVPLGIEKRQEGGVKLSFGQNKIIAPLGPLRIDGLELASVEDRLVLRSVTTIPILNGLTSEPAIELCYGDEIRTFRTGPLVIEVLPP